MRKSMLLLSFMTASSMLCSTAIASDNLTDADWLSAAKAALQLTSRSGAVNFVIDDDVSPQARHALASLRKVVPLADVPNQSPEFSKPGDYMRILRFRVQGDRIEFQEGSVYPKVYKPDDCRLSTQLFLARTADGEWKQDGPAKMQICSRH